MITFTILATLLTTSVVLADSEQTVAVRKTGASCRGTRTEFEVGYGTDNDFSKVYTACFDEKLLTPVYIQYSFNGGGSDSTIEEPYFDSGNLYQNLDITELIANQDDILADLGVQMANYELEAVQILPQSYISDPSDKYASLDYIDVVPVWDSTAEVWLNLLRNTLAQCDNEYLFNGGTLGVADLENAQGESVDLYLSDGKIPVPRWIWYLGCDNRQFYVYNNPLVKITDVLDEVYQFCSNPVLASNYIVCQH